MTDEDAEERRRVNASMMQFANEWFVDIEVALGQTAEDEFGNIDPEHFIDREHNFGGAGGSGGGGDGEYVPEIEMEEGEIVLDEEQQQQQQSDDSNNEDGSSSSTSGSSGSNGREAQTRSVLSDQRPASRAPPRQSRSIQTARQVHSESIRQRGIVQSEMHRTNLELQRAKAFLQRETAFNFVLMRVRAMLDCLWNWVYSHYAEQGRMLNAAVYDKETFRIILCSADCELEEMQPGIAWYISGHNERYLFATLLFDISMSPLSRRVLNIATTLLGRMHSSSADAMAVVGQLQYDEYWTAFLGVVHHEMCGVLRKLRLENELKHCENAARFLDEFYWCEIRRQAKQQATTIDHRKVFNDSTRDMMCRNSCSALGSRSRAEGNIESSRVSTTAVASAAATATGTTTIDLLATR